MAIGPGAKTGRTPSVVPGRRRRRPIVAKTAVNTIGVVFMTPGRQGVFKTEGRNAVFMMPGRQETFTSPGRNTIFMTEGR